MVSEPLPVSFGVAQGFFFVFMIVSLEIMYDRIHKTGDRRCETRDLRQEA